MTTLRSARLARTCFTSFSPAKDYLTRLSSLSVENASDRSLRKACFVLALESSISMMLLPIAGINIQLDFRDDAHFTRASMR